MGGVLARAGFEEDEIGDFVGTVARTAGDPEVDDRTTAARDSAARRAKGESAHGLPRLSELVGERVATCTAKWLGLNEGPFGPGAASSDRIAGQAGIGADRQPRVLSYQGIISPIERDPLQIALDPDPSPSFPVDCLPLRLRGAVEALAEHVQAPHAMCAHSVLSAAAIATQGLANVDVKGLPTPRPLSLLMMVVAVSGERKSACDDLALVAVKKQ